MKEVVEAAWDFWWGLGGGVREHLAPWSEAGPLLARLAPEKVLELAECLRDEYEYVRLEAAQALKAMGPAAAHPEVLRALLACLRYGDALVRDEAARALGAMRAADRPEVHQILQQYLRDENELVQLAAVRAFLQVDDVDMDDVAAHLDDMLAPLPVGLIERKEKGAARPEVLQALLERLRDEDKDVRYAAALDLWKMGPAAATPEVLQALTECLYNDWDDVRWWAANALEAMGPAAATPEVLQALTECLYNLDDVREAAAKALGAMGPAAATPEVLQALAGCLGESDPEDVREAAAKALRRMGPAAATPEVLQALTECLYTYREEYVCYAAAKALTAWHRQGLRFFRDAQGRWTVRTVEELSWEPRSTGRGRRRR
jgi:HEAT repeat protein